MEKLKNKAGYIIEYQKFYPEFEHAQFNSKTLLLKWLNTLTTFIIIAIDNDTTYQLNIDKGGEVLNTSINDIEFNDMYAGKIIDLETLEQNQKIHLLDIHKLEMIPTNLLITKVEECTKNDLKKM